MSATWCNTAASSKKIPTVATWQRFEQSFKSKVGYTNALQDVAFSLTFTSPSGETTKVDGFWDGDKIWRVRFAPKTPGKWSYRTICSDTTNPNLHNQTGEFLCTAMVGNSRFHQHGPVRVASDHRHLEHTDGTPFFWLADTVWNGPQRAEPGDWNAYVGARTLQKFTVAQWVAAPGVDVKKQTAFTGNQRIELNPGFFQKLDEKLDGLDRAGILSAIVPFRENDPSTTNKLSSLPEAQVVLLLRYQVARWGANNVVWLLTCEGNTLGGNVARWKRIGRAVFGERAHAPVLLFPGETDWVLDEFRGETWVDLFGYQSGQGINDDTLKWAVAGPLVNEWRKKPFRPLINVAPPYENEWPTPPAERTSAESVRRALYWSLLIAPTAGVSYGAYGVQGWTEDTKPKDKSSKRKLPLWNKSLFMPVANQMATLSDFFDAIEYWQLRPAPELVFHQPGDKEPRRFIAAARTESKDVTIVYVPEDRTVELRVEVLPPSPTMVWINPRTGERSFAAAVTGPSSCQFSTPNPGDWLLVIRAVKQQP
ncbi:MAG: DUF4038 domain-containing protein [Verrucomicrobia bacterium]|nr:DUF4038 domain-containing protein [Verrucomicrobiota bacterium]